MPGLDWLDSKHAIYLSHEAAWKREEKRLQGGDGVLDELVQFAHEDAASYTARRSWARWIGFGKVNATVLAGHITRQTPLPNYGPLGEVKARTERSGSLAELFHYNCDSVGNDGQEIKAFMDSVEQRALATGFRWLMMEMPTRATLSAIRIRLGVAELQANGMSVTDAEVRSGFRTFVVEYSPLAVTNWRFIDGVLIWAVVRVLVEDEKGDEALGYYVLVRGGYRSRGDGTKSPGEKFNGGGWWKFDAQKVERDTGNWSDTSGQIPLWLHLGEPGVGTYERPSIGTSSTMELGQISADLMNAQSEQRFNLRQAAKSIMFGLGTTKPVHEAVVEQLGDGTIFVGVPPAVGPTGEPVIPTIWSSSAAALDSAAYGTVIDASTVAAKEIMVRQVAAGPDASGARVEAEHESATSPMLARIAGTAESSWNTLLYFLGRRMGLTHEAALGMSIQLPRDFKLRDVLDDIDAMLGTLKRSWLRSPTWEADLLQKAGDERGLLPEEKTLRTKILGELEASAQPTEPVDETLDDLPETPGRQTPQAKAAVDGLMAPDGSTDAQRAA